MTSLALRVTDVTKRFGTVTALDGVSLALEAGVVTGLLGPNGAGKTTLIRLCAGWLEPDRGVVDVMGEGEAYHKGRLMKGATAMKRAGVKPVTLKFKEGLALINGSQFFTACGALRVYDAERLMKTAIIASAPLTRKNADPVTSGTQT